MKGSNRLTLTEIKATAAPSIDDVVASKKPGQTPYAKPMRVMLAENPKRGGCEAITALMSRKIPAEGPASGPMITYQRAGSR